MTHGADSLRWEATDGSDRVVVELPETTDSRNVVRTITELVRSCHGCVSLVLVRLAKPTSRTLIDLLAAVAATDRPIPHLGILARPDCLDWFVGQSLSDRSGLVLDIAGANATFDSFTRDHVEAVRFGAADSHGRVDSLRSDIVLQSMATLARDLGLATLGPAPRRWQDLGAGEPLFDYCLSNPPRPIPSERRARTASGNATPFPAR